MNRKIIIHENDIILLVDLNLHIMEGLSEILLIHDIC